MEEWSVALAPRPPADDLLQMLRSDLWSAMMRAANARNGGGERRSTMGEARSPANVSETFHERLRAAALPEPLRLSIHNSLGVLLEDDGDGVAPDDRSFAALLKFVSGHPRWIAPGLTINRQGAFTAVWEIPGVFRWSLTFLPVGDIEWTELEKSPAAGLVRHAGKGRADSIELPRQLRQSILAY
jgi:hypothetical protein